MKTVWHRSVVLTSVLALAGSVWAANLDASRGGQHTGNAPQASFQPSTNIISRLEALGDFSILLTALETANLTDAVATGGPFTLFAPTDQAFAELLDQLEITAPELLENPELGNILLYHVAPGKQRAADLLRSSTQSTLLEGQSVLVLRQGTNVLVNGAKVTRADVATGNGLIHVINSVLLPQEEPTSITSILDVLQLDGRFSILLTALQTAGLDDAVAGSGPFTLFAPTDQAFAELLAKLEISAGDLLESPDLSNILLYHVLGSRQSATQLLLSRQATTLAEEDLSFRLRRTGIYVNDSRVINPNVNAPNGLIHVIDEVLLP